MQSMQLIYRPNVKVICSDMNVYKGELANAVVITNYSRN